MPERDPMVDVVIVGAGAAGSVFAAILAEAGRRVLILERGGERSLADLYSSQIWARRLKSASPHVAEDGPDSIWHNFNAGHGVGGAAIHHYAVWPRYHPEDFELASRHGRGLDWPFGYAELRPYYDRIQADVGVAGDAQREIWRPAAADYPLPPVPLGKHGAMVARGFEKLGLRTAPLPMAILTEPYDGRPACLWDGWCDAGCPIGALANPLAVYLPRAARAGARLRTHAGVTRVRTDPGGQRATGVEYVDAAGRRRFQPAGAVVLAAFTIENVRILLNSANDKHPRGLANGSDALGRYLMCHPSVSVFGMFDEATENHLGATGGQLLCQDRYDKRGDPGGAFGSRQWMLAQALKPNDLLGIAMSRADLYGEKLLGFMREAALRLGTMTGICEDQASPDNRIRLDAARDRHGMPLAKVTYRMSDDGRALWKTAAKEGLEIFRAAGAKDPWHGPPGGQHVMGGTVMGRDPARSVADGNGRCHEVANLFIGGPSLLPSSCCVNSTFTVHALALKSAQHMVRHRQEGTS